MNLIIKLLWKDWICPWPVAISPFLVGSTVNFTREVASGTGPKGAGSKEVTGPKEAAVGTGPKVKKKFLYKNFYK